MYNGLFVCCRAIRGAERMRAFGGRAGAAVAVSAGGAGNGRAWHLLGGMLQAWLSHILNIFYSHFLSYLFDDLPIFLVFQIKRNYVYTGKAIGMPLRPGIFAYQG